MVWSIKESKTSLGINPNLNIQIYNAKPKIPVVSNWMTEQNSDARVIGLAKLAMADSSTPKSLRLSERVKVTNFMYNFPRAGALRDIDDLDMVARATNSINWIGVVPLAEAIGLGVVQVESPNHKSPIEVTVPILADKVIEENVPSEAFTRYYSKIAIYLATVASGVDQIINWQNYRRLLQVGWVENWEADEWGGSSGSTQMYAAKDVPQRSILDIVNKYINTDSVARWKTGSKLGQSAAFMQEVNELSHDYLEYEYTHHPKVSVASIGSPKNKTENNWLNMTVTELIDYLTAMQRASILGPVMGAVATEAFHVYSSFSNMITSTGNEERGLLKEFNGHFHGFWSGLSAKVGLDFIYKAIPWSADAEMGGYWLEGLQKRTSNKKLAFWEW